MSDFIRKPARKRNFCSIEDLIRPSPSPSPPREVNEGAIEGPPASKRAFRPSPEPEQDAQREEDVSPVKEEADDDDDEEEKLEDYVRQLGAAERHYNQKFKSGKFTTTFIIENLPANPEELLKELFQKCINGAIESDRQQSGLVPDRLGVRISSPLLDTDIWIPMRKIEADTTENILNRFLQIVQSRERDGKDSVLGAPFTVRVDTVNVGVLPTRRHLIGSAPRVPQLQHHFRETALIRINNTGNPYCLFYALELSRIHNTYEKDTRAFHSYLVREPARQLQDVRRLMQNADIPLDRRSYDAYIYVPFVVDYWNRMYEQSGFRFKVFVFAERGDYRPLYQYGPQNFNTPIAILHAGEHFDGVRRCGQMMREGYKYCFRCLTLYRKASKHSDSCKGKCDECGRMRLCEAERFFRKECQECGRIYRNRECYEAHLHKRKGQKKSECQKKKYCYRCGKMWNVEKNTVNGRPGHVCGENFCQKCLQWHNLQKGCYILPLEPKKKHPYRLVNFDFETMQHEAVPGRPEEHNHQVNFVGAHISCTECMGEEGEWRRPLRASGKECEICGEHRTITFSVRPYRGAQVDKQVVVDNPLRAFVRWLLFELPSLPVFQVTMAFSHFGGRFDMMFVFREIYLMGIIPKMIARGNKLYDLHVQKNRKIGCGDVMFRDSYNLVPQPLGKLVGAFGLTTPDKPFFPHLSNRPENYDKVLLQLPPPSDYLYGGFFPDKQRKFDQWYAAETAKGATFELNEALAEYCMNDVWILTEALLTFRRDFLKKTNKQWIEEEVGIACEDGGGIDILRENKTIASACMQHFCLNHIKKDHVAIVRESGYGTGERQSFLALKYMKWIEEVEGVQIQTANSEGGEKKIGRFKLDGYVQAADRGIEVNGCVWHAHHCRFSDPDMVIKQMDKTVAKVREENESRRRFLESRLGGGLKIVWECEIEKQLKQDKKMKAAFANYRDDGPIRIRDAFYGGRTGPFCLHHIPPEGHKIAYYDFCSLYPFTTATTPYPVGHPKCIVNSGKDQLVDWTLPEHVPVTGMLKVFVVPPTEIDVPVLPAKFDSRLLFPLCRACSLAFPNGGVMPNYECPHTSNEERGWMSTCTSIELQEALRQGYRVTNYYRGWHYDVLDAELFKGYVSEMMEDKIHATGFPDTILTEEEEDKFIEECAARFGIKIDKDQMKENPALRLIAKLMNNNLWGRFGLRNDLSKSVVVNCPVEFRSIVENECIELSSMDELTDDTFLIKFVPHKEFIEENPTSNVILALWTTSAARLILLKSLQKVARTPGGKLLYCDTDSIIFSYPVQQGCPLETGVHLGDLTNEYPAHEIVEFVSGGAKQYALRMKHVVTGEEKIVMKIRGMTLGGDVAKQLHFDTFKQSIMEFGKQTIEGQTSSEQNYTIATENQQLRPSIKHGSVVTRKFRKLYKPVVLKGVVTAGLEIKDFGKK